MRKAAWIFLVIVCVCFCGCTAQSAPPRTTDFSCTVSVNAAGFCCEGTLERGAVGCLQLCCSSPDTLKGMRVALSGNSAVFSQNGREWECTIDGLSDEAVFLRLCRVMDAAALSRGVGNGTVNGVCQNTPFTLTFDSKTGNLIQLDVPNWKFSVTFSDFCP